MANLTNSAKLIEEMNKKAYKTELPTVNNATVTVAVNGNTGTNSFTTNQASNSTLKITVGKSDVGLGNVDNTSDANKPISTATQAALDLKADKSEISSVYKYKGSKANYDALPSSGNVTGDVWNVETAHTTAPVFPAGSNLAWDGSAWDVLGGTVDLSNYLAKDNTTAFTPTGDYNPATKKYVDNNKITYTFDMPIVGSDISAILATGFYCDIILVENGGITERDYYRVVMRKPENSRLYAAYGNPSSGIYVAKKINYNGSTNLVTSIQDVSKSYFDSSTVLTKTNTTSYTPSGDYNPATKKYVDDKVNVIAISQNDYNNLSASEKADGKLRIITDAPQIEIPDYESKSAASGGTDESLVTTGEKYTWNNKADASDVLTKTNTTSFTPTADYQPATKKYVDDGLSSKIDITEITYEDELLSYVDLVYIIGGGPASNNNDKYFFPSNYTNVLAELNSRASDYYTKFQNSLTTQFSQTNVLYYQYRSSPASRYAIRWDGTKWVYYTND